MRSLRRRVEALTIRSEDDREREEIEAMEEWMRSLTRQGRDEVREILEEADEAERAGRPVDLEAGIQALLEVTARDEARRGVGAEDGNAG